MSQRKPYALMRARRDGQTALLPSDRVSCPLQFATSTLAKQRPHETETKSLQLSFVKRALWIGVKRAFTVVLAFLSEIVKEAGVRGGPSALDRGGCPPGRV
jgi:hypothetical protein